MVLNMIEDRYQIDGVDFPVSLESNLDDYPMEVSLTGAALEKIADCFYNNRYSKIDIWADMKSGKLQRVCTINSGLFGLMMKYSIVFKSLDTSIPSIDNSVYSVYQRLLVNYSFLDALLLKPRVENNSWDVPSLVFPVPSFKIERPESGKVGLFENRTFSVLPKEVECDKVVSLNPVYILGKLSYTTEYSMEVKYSETVAPNFLRIEMDYREGEWKLVAIQRKQV